MNNPESNKPAKPSFARLISLQIILTLTIIANIIGAGSAIRNFEAFLLTYPKLNWALGYLYILCALIVVVGAYYLWKLKKSGLYVVCIAFITIIGLDFYAAIPFQHTLSAIGLLVLIIITLIPVRRYLT